MSEEQNCTPAGHAAIPGDPVANIFGAGGASAFIENSLGKEVVHGRGEATRFAGLVSWDDLNRALETHRLAPPRLALVNNGKNIPVERFTRAIGTQTWLDAGRLTALLGQGASLTFSFVDEVFPEVRRYADALAQALHAHVNVNLYAGFRRERGFAEHWDRHDVIAVQVAGRKRWRVREPSRPFPHRDERREQEPHDGPFVLDAMIEAGDMVYIPRGWWHFAEPQDEPSLHLTFAIERPTAPNFVEWLGKRLLDDPLARADLPSHGSPEEQEVFVHGLGDAAKALFTPAMLSEFLASWRADRRARPRFRLPQVASFPAGGIGPQTGLRLANQRGLAPRTGVGGASEFTVGGRDWPCGATVGDALARLRSDAQVVLAELQQGLTPSEQGELQAILQGLVMAGEVVCDFADD